MSYDQSRDEDIICRSFDNRPYQMFNQIPINESIAEEDDQYLILENNNVYVG